MCRDKDVCTCLVPCTRCLCSLDVGKGGEVTSVFLRNDPDVAPAVTFEDRKGNTKTLTRSHVKCDAKGIRVNL